MLELLCDAIVAFVLSFVVIYTTVFLLDAIFVEEREEPFSLESFIKNIRNKL